MLFYIQSGRHSQLLKKARQFINHALELNTDQNSTHLIAADIDLALGNTKDAIQHYKKAMSIDETSVETMNGMIEAHIACFSLANNSRINEPLLSTGMIHCQLLQGANKDAALQLELLGELSPTIEVTGVRNSFQLIFCDI